MQLKLAPRWPCDLYTTQSLCPSLTLYLFPFLYLSCLFPFLRFLPLSYFLMFLCFLSLSLFSSFDCFPLSPLSVPLLSFLLCYLSSCQSSLLHVFPFPQTLLGFIFSPCLCTFLFLPLSLSAPFLFIFDYDPLCHSFPSLSLSPTLPLCCCSMSSPVFSCTKQTWCRFVPRVLPGRSVLGLVSVLTFRVYCISKLAGFWIESLMTTKHFL